MTTRRDPVDEGGDSRPVERRPMRVMQSFGVPRVTSNPYIHMLDAALAETPGIVHQRFARVRALLGRYDVIHFHWPETLFGTGRGVKGLLRWWYANLLRIRLSLGQVAVVRTVHNIGLPSGVTGSRRRYLEWVERRADHRIVLNGNTELEPGQEATLIPHGHYRDWFAQVPREQLDPSALAFVGLVRRYKGVEGLIDAFTNTAADYPQLQLRIAGRPTSPELAAEVRRRTSGDSRIELDLRYLSEEDFAAAIMRSTGVVLPYRFMHNSGAVLAALSLDRPVLVPRNDVNEALAAEVGPGWITMFDGDVDAHDLVGFMAAVSKPRAHRPDLSAREWSDTGAAHRDAFSRAVAHRQGSTP